MIELSRRELIERLALATAAVHLLPATSQAAESECEGVSELSAAQKKVRESLEYTDNSPKEDKKCKGCQLFKKPKGEATCGGCQTVPGPIHPQGWCTAWVAKSS